MTEFRFQRILSLDTDGYVSTEEVRQALRSLYRNDAEANLQLVLRESLSDELRPIDEKGRWKPSPILILIFLALCAIAGVVIYFSIGGRS